MAARSLSELDSAPLHLCENHVQFKGEFTLFLNI